MNLPLVIFIVLMYFYVYFSLYFQAPRGKRGWKTFYAVLKGMILYLQKVCVVPPAHRFITNITHDLISPDVTHLFPTFFAETVPAPPHSCSNTID